MKRWFWALLAVSVVVLAIAFAVFPLGGGGNDSRSYAEGIPGDTNGDTVVNTGDVNLSVDMDPTNGAGPCNPVDTSANEPVGANYTVAICLTSSPAEPAGFEFQVVYDDTLNQCVPATSCAQPALDCNPDANTGTTVFPPSDLGQVNFDCSGGGLDLPNCDKDTATGAGHGVAHIVCSTVAGMPTLAIGVGVSSPIVEVAFHALAGGVDNLVLDNVALVDPDVNAILNCPGGPGVCFNGQDTKVAPTDTPGPTATSTTAPAPTATSTTAPAPTATSTTAPAPSAASTTVPAPTATSTTVPAPTATSTTAPAPTATSTTAPPTATATKTKTPMPAATNTPSPQGCLDLNGDGKVSGRDVAIVARALFTHPGNRRWNPVADVNGDGRVNLTDLFLVIKSMQNKACRTMID
jgi:hypothetical protein